MTLRRARLADYRATDYGAVGWPPTMQKHIFLNRTATLAIAATVAFSNAPLLAQDASAAEAPAESTTADPVAAEPAPDAVATDPHAGHSPEPASAASASPKPRAKASTKASAPIAKPAQARAATAAAPAPTPTPLESTPITSPLSAPIAEPVAEPTADTVEPVLAVANDELERAAFAGILALLALGGAATAVSRRRRAHAAPRRPVVYEGAHTAPMPAGRAPVRHEASAFAWGRTPAVTPPIANTGGSWTERARRGPTPDNPSLSLKKRLKRAAFYEQRERAVAAGRAKPIVPSAGLPERATENFRQGWTPQPNYTHAFQPA